MRLALLFVAIFGFVIGCSMAYKPDIHDSTINHQSGNKPATDVNLNLGRK